MNTKPMTSQERTEIDRAWGALSPIERLTLAMSLVSEDRDADLIQEELARLVAQECGTVAARGVAHD